MSMASEVFSPRGGYDLLAHTSGLVSSLLEPKNAAITAGVAAANTNPFTGIPVDAALVAHGGYGMAKNAPAALKGNPDAVQNFFLSGAEAAGGAAGTAGQVRAVTRSGSEGSGGEPGTKRHQERHSKRLRPARLRRKRSRQRWPRLRLRQRECRRRLPGLWASQIRHRISS